MSFSFPSLASDAVLPIRRERSNVVRLAVAQALAGANSTVVYATGAVVGNMLTPTEALATLPPEVNRRRFDHAYQRRFQASRYRPSR